MGGQQCDELVTCYGIFITVFSQSQSISGIGIIADHNSLRGDQAVGCLFQTRTFSSCVLVVFFLVAGPIGVGVIVQVKQIDYRGIAGSSLQHQNSEFAEKSTDQRLVPTCKYFEESKEERSKMCAFSFDFLIEGLTVCLQGCQPLCMCFVELCIFIGTTTVFLEHFCISEKLLYSRINFLLEQLRQSVDACIRVLG